MNHQRQATATITPLGEANQFTTSGPIVVSYSRTSISGVPLLSYADAELAVRFSGEEITQVPTAVGELVTVTLEDVVDAFVRRFSLLIPRISVAMGDQVEFEAVGIDTVDRSLAFVPAPGPEGVLQTYRVHDVHGVAERVAF